MGNKRSREICSAYRHTPTHRLSLTSNALILPKNGGQDARRNATTHQMSKSSQVMPSCVRIAFEKGGEGQQYARHSARIIDLVHHGDGSAMESIVLYRPACGIGLKSDFTATGAGINQEKADGWGEISDPWLRIKKKSVLIPPKSCSHDPSNLGPQRRFMCMQRITSPFSPPVKRPFTAAAPRQTGAQPVEESALSAQLPTLCSPRRPSASFSMQKTPKTGGEGCEVDLPALASAVPPVHCAVLQGGVCIGGGNFWGFTAEHLGNGGVGLHCSH
ncbi:hypothetical protein GGI43DRAFT_168895 [Trichoderma evansii]